AGIRSCVCRDVGLSQRTGASLHDHQGNLAPGPALIALIRRSKCDQLWPKCRALFGCCEPGVRRSCPTPDIDGCRGTLTQIKHPVGILPGPALRAYDERLIVERKVGEYHGTWAPGP